ncbi:hypothetical protein F5X97DRAFT_324481 [Nemania serpens]|nr:hypothetical protein F5X97DRAFT_324481 [Nemania serpens]
MDTTPTNVATATPHSTAQEAPPSESGGGHKSNQIPALYIVAIAAGVAWAIIILLVVIRCTTRCRKRKTDPELGEGDNPEKIQVVVDLEAGRNIAQNEKAHQARPVPVPVPEAGPNKAGPLGTQNDGEFVDIPLTSSVGTARALTVTNVQKAKKRGGAPFFKPARAASPNPDDSDFYDSP